MKNWMRRIRAAVGVGVVWGVAWLGVGLVLLLIVLLWGLDQRAKRRDAEDDVVLARHHADILADDMPFPRGRRLP